MTVGEISSRSIWATLPRTERGRPLVLGPDPKGEQFLYCHGNSVVIRNLKNPEVSDIYTQHSYPVNVAKYSPSGFYVASADKSGKVRIWDTVNKEHVLKAEYQPISGPINDLAWSSDNQRIVVVGEGREKFGHVFLADTGTSNGDISGQTRPLNSCDFRPSRPFRIITGSEDNTVAHYEGPPFKFKGTKHEHTGYCQCVRYSHDGVFWASAGFDGRIILYDGKESELITEFMSDGKKAHSGGVYAIAWGPTNKNMLSASGDKTCKFWDVENRKPIQTFVMGDSVEDQQLGCLWSGDILLSVSLAGYISYLDPRSGDVPVRVIKGHNKPITKMCLGKDSQSLLTGGSDGRVVKWCLKDASCVAIRGEGHGCQVTGIRAIHKTKVASVGIDDTLRYMDLADDTYLAQEAFKLNSQPRGIAHSGSLTTVVNVNSIILFKDGAMVGEKKVEFEPSCVAIHPDGAHVVVGEASPGTAIRVYTERSGDLEEVKSIVLTGNPVDVAYSPDGQYLVAADSNRKVSLFDSGKEYEKAHGREWGFHTAKVNCVAWSPDCKWVASGGLDCCIIVWSVVQPEKHVILTSAHTQSQITGLVWMDNHRLLSCGQDGNVKSWDVAIH